MIEHIDKLIANYEAQIASLTELKRLVHIADLLGVRPKEVEGRVQVAVKEGFGRTPWVHATYSVRAGEGPWHDFKLTDVPELLWPDHIREAKGRVRRVISL